MNHGILLGIAGEYFVAGELSRRGYIASITLRNTASIDILASNGEKTVNIQVKSRWIETDGWKMGNAPLDFKGVSDNVFYVFVEIHSDPSNKGIVYYVIPKKILNERVEENYQKWKEGVNLINGKPRTATLRIFRIEEYPEFQTSKYKDNWQILFS